MRYGILNRPPHFDVHQSGTVGNIGTQGCMFDNLIRRDPRDSGKSIVPDLAHSWEIAKDGKTYTFHLRHELSVGQRGISANECELIRLRRGSRFQLAPHQHEKAPQSLYADGSESDRLLWHLSGDSIVKELPITATNGLLLTANRIRSGDKLWNRLLNPAEPSLPAASPISSIDIQLQPRDTPILGWIIPWWATFFLVAMIAALIAGKFMGVQY
jgi:hypothetical protein